MPWFLVCFLNSTNLSHSGVWTSPLWDHLDGITCLCFAWDISWVSHLLSSTLSSLSPMCVPSPTLITLRWAAPSNPSSPCVDTMSVNTLQVPSYSWLNNYLLPGSNSSDGLFCTYRPEEGEKGAVVGGKTSARTMGSLCLQLECIFSSWGLLDYLFQPIPQIILSRARLTVLFYPLSFSELLIKIMRLLFISKAERETRSSQVTTC